MDLQTILLPASACCDPLSMIYVSIDNKIRMRCPMWKETKWKIQIHFSSFFLVLFSQIAQPLAMDEVAVYSYGLVDMIKLYTYTYMVFVMHLHIKKWKTIFIFKSDFNFAESKRNRRKKKQGTNKNERCAYAFANMNVWDVWIHYAFWLCNIFIIRLTASINWQMPHAASGNNNNKYIQFPTTEQNLRQNNSISHPVGE